MSKALHPMPVGGVHSISSHRVYYVHVLHESYAVSDSFYFIYCSNVVVSVVC